MKPKLTLAGACALAAGALLLFPCTGRADSPAPAPPQFTVPGGSGDFDWMAADPDKQRILASHPDTHSIAILDLSTAVVQSVDTGVACSGIAVDTADDKYFFGGDGQKIEVFDREKLTKIDEIPLTGPVDDMVYDPDNGTIYADHDDGTEVWAIDAKSDKITGSVAIGEAPEYVQYDRKGHLLYQNIKSADEVQVIDPSTNKVVNTWPTAPATSPHGLALVTKRNWVLSAGKNGKLVAIDTATGQVAFSTDIKPDVDQISYDPEAHRAYCACKGFVSVVQVAATGLTDIADLPVPASAHSLVVDPTSGYVWYCYADGQNSYLAELPSAPVVSN